MAMGQYAQGVRRIGSTRCRLDVLAGSPIHWHMLEIAEPTELGDSGFAGKLGARSTVLPPSKPALELEGLDATASPEQEGIRDELQRRQIDIARAVRRQVRKTAIQRRILLLHGID